MILLLLVTGTPTLADDSEDDGSEQRESVHYRIDVTKTLGPANRALNGYVWNAPSELSNVELLEPEHIRIDARLGQISPKEGEIDTSHLQTRIEEIRRIGAEPLVILAYMPKWLSSSDGSDGRSPGQVGPSDLDKWEELIYEVVRHSVTAEVPAFDFEVWNEPDLPKFWQDTPAAFLEMAVRTHRAVARVKEDTGLPVRIGGPSTAFPNPVLIPAYVETMRVHGLPLDYVSWHYYGNYPFIGPDGEFDPTEDPIGYLQSREDPLLSPSEFGWQIEWMRALLEPALLGSNLNPELIITEWNISAASEDLRRHDHVGASFTAATLMEMEYAQLDWATYYRSIDHPNAAPPGSYGVTLPDGTPKPVWWVFDSWRATDGMRLPVHGPLPDAVKLWVRATRHSGYVDVLLAAFDANGGQEQEITLEFVAGTDDDDVDIEQGVISRIDASSPNFATAEPLDVDDDDGPLRLVVPPQSVTWLRLAIDDD